MHKVTSEYGKSSKRYNPRAKIVLAFKSTDKLKPELRKVPKKRSFYDK
jgi:hypothetical protein